VNDSEEAPNRMTSPSNSYARLEDVRERGSSLNGSKRISMNHASVLEVGRNGSRPHPERMGSWSVSVGWPEDVQVREHFLHVSLTPLQSTVNLRCTVAKQGALHLESEDVPEGSWAYWERLNLKVLSPGSRIRGVVDVFVLCLIIFDMGVVPLELSWGREDDTEMYAASCVTTLLWFVDLALNFFTGRYSNGQLRMTIQEVSLHYLRTWFFLDFTALCCDLVAVGFWAFDATFSFTSWKIARTGSLLRCFKILLAWQSVTDRVLSQNIRLGVRCFKVVLNILLFNHIVSCTWFALGRSTELSDTGARWVDMTVPFYQRVPHGETTQRVEDFRDQTRVYQYSVVYHLCMAQMTGGNEMVDAYNSLERLFCALGLTMGLLLCSTVISSLSAAFIEFQMESWDTVRKLESLARFLRENNVRPSVAVSTQREVALRLRERPALTEADVPVLVLLSSESKVRLRFEMFGRHLLTHPLFRLWLSLDPMAVEHFCMEAMEAHVLMPRDELFKVASRREECFMVISGALEYVQVPDMAPVEEEIVSIASVGSWLSEAALWMYWTSVGTATAVKECQAFSLQAEEVAQVISRRQTMSVIAAEYGSIFHKAVQSALPPEAPYPSDLSVPFTDYAELVMAMRPEAQVVIGLQALEHMKQQWKFMTLTDKSTRSLEEEVRSGKCTLVVTGTGEPQRVTSVCALEVQDSEDRYLTQICRWDNEVAVPLFQLPGGKQERGERPHDALRRLLGTKLKPLQDRLQIQRSEREVSLKVSDQHLVQTEYTKNIFIARLEGSDPLAAPLCSKRKDANSYSNRPSAATLPIRWMGTEKVTHGHSMKHLAELLHLDVYLFETDRDGRCASYAWLTDDQYRFLSTVAGHTVLLQWVSHLEIRHAYSERSAEDRRMVGLDSGQMEEVTRSSTDHHTSGGSVMASMDGTVFSVARQNSISAVQRAASRRSADSGHSANPAASVTSSDTSDDQKLILSPEEVTLYEEGKFPQFGPEGHNWRHVF